MFITVLVLSKMCRNTYRFFDKLSFFRTIFHFLKTFLQVEKAYTSILRYFHILKEIVQIKCIIM